jgi:hypothetical protein
MLIRAKTPNALAAACSSNLGRWSRPVPRITLMTPLFARLARFALIVSTLSRAGAPANEPPRPKPDPGVATGRKAVLLSVVAGADRVVIEPLAQPGNN